MSISVEEVKKKAKLCRIFLSEERAKSISEEINSMFDFVSQISEVDLSEVEPLISVSEHEIPMRKDIVNDGNIAAEIMQNAPLSHENFFLVPKVVE